MSIDPTAASASAAGAPLQTGAAEADRAKTEGAAKKASADRAKLADRDIDEADLSRSDVGDRDADGRLLERPPRPRAPNETEQEAMDPPGADSDDARGRNLDLEA